MSNNNNKMASSKQTTEYTTTTTATPGGGTHKRWHYAEEEQQQVTHVEESYDADSEDEWEFENFAHSVENGVDHYLVAGGGMMNGNAYAEVVVYPLLKKVCYVEHGKYGTVTTYRNSTLKWDTEGRAVCFDIVAINS